MAEEDYSKSISYKKFSKHKNEHDEFIKKFSDIDFSVVDTNQDTYLMKVIEFVAKSIEHHILIEDLKYLQ
jgi:hemerythrin